jgi:flagellar M-ring protein FliF
MEPELSVEDLLVSTQMEELIEEDTPLEPIGYNEKSEAMQKLDSFIDEKPEAAASLLRHWLNEAEF